MGGKTGRFALSGGREYAAFRIGSPLRPGGERGESEEKGTRVQDRSRGSLKATASLVQTGGAPQLRFSLGFPRVIINPSPSAERRYRISRY